MQMLIYWHLHKANTYPIYNTFNTLELRFRYNGVNAITPDLDQIQLGLGHASIQMTKRYTERT